MSADSSATSSPEPSVGAVIVAGGSGRRMGGVRKQYLELAGEPVLLWSVRAFLHHPRVSVVVVVLPSDDAASPPEWLAGLPVRVAAGGAERSDSVRNGLRALDGAVEIALIHDGARPFVGREVIDRVISASREGGAVAAVRVTDTLKEVDDGGRITGTADRARLWRAQTPQGFPLRLIVNAHETAHRQGVQATDDAALCERMGHAVRVVEGAAENLKITSPDDLALAELLARRLRATTA
ncbi:MAG TPA: 2-C-methyl-D-erythritol 4-phosphate cytidylyltransferase [Longimicrobiaceae bacterium]|nr:2-C-methyl-D-erythritol 4-phosphate cytidylyltransferase [Longimicrobiaceae bacterium]